MTYLKKNFAQKVNDKNFKQKLRHLVAQALRVEAEAIQKLPLPHPWFWHERIVIGWALAVQISDDEWQWKENILTSYH